MQKKLSFKQHLHSLDLLKESVGHSTSNDHLVDLVQQILDELNLVSNFSTSEDGKEWSGALYDLITQYMGCKLSFTSRGCREPWQSS